MAFNDFIGIDPATDWIIENELKGLAVGDIRVDNKGRKFQLWKLSSDLTNNTTAANEVAVREASNVVTNKPANGLDTTNCIAAGVFTGAIAESSGTTASTQKYVWVLIHGVTTIKTNGDDDIAAGDELIPDASNGGCCDSFAPTSTNPTANDLAKMLHSVFATALAADVDASNTVSALVHVRG